MNRSSVMSVTDMIKGMMQRLEIALGDAEKHDRGNGAAGTRVRVAMQYIKAEGQSVRVQVQNDKKSR